MGSPLGVLLGIFHTSCVEEKVLSKIKKPEIYCCYFDNIFIKITNKEDIEQPKKSVYRRLLGLTFTAENGISGTMPLSSIETPPLVS